MCVLVCKHTLLFWQFPFWPAGAITLKCISTCCPAGRYGDDTFSSPSYSTFKSYILAETLSSFYFFVFCFLFSGLNLSSCRKPSLCKDTRTGSEGWSGHLEVSEANARAPWSVLTPPSPSAFGNSIMVSTTLRASILLVFSRGSNSAFANYVNLFQCARFCVR